VAPEVDSEPASIAEIAVGAAGLGAAGIVAWSLATLRDTGAGPVAVLTLLKEPVSDTLEEIWF